MVPSYLSFFLDISIGSEINVALCTFLTDSIGSGSVDVEFRTCFHQKHTITKRGKEILKKMLFLPLVILPIILYKKDKRRFLKLVAYFFNTLRSFYL